MLDQFHEPTVPAWAVERGKSAFLHAEGGTDVSLLSAGEATPRSVPGKLLVRPAVLPLRVTDQTGSFEFSRPRQGILPEGFHQIVGKGGRVRNGLQATGVSTAKAVARQTSSQIVPEPAQDGSILVALADQAFVSDPLFWTHAPLLSKRAMGDGEGTHPGMEVEAFKEIVLVGNEEVEVGTAVFVEFDHANPGEEERIKQGALDPSQVLAGLDPANVATKDEREQGAVVGSVVLEESGEVGSVAQGGFGFSMGVAGLMSVG